MRSLRLIALVCALATQSVWAQAPADSAPAVAPNVNTARASDVAKAVALAELWLARSRSANDHNGVANALTALSPWRTSDNPPLAILQTRARVLQYDHQFDAALADLQRILAQQPRNAQAHIEAATLHIASARYDEARTHCEALAGLAARTAATLCQAQLDASTNQSARARTALIALTENASSIPAAQLSWTYTLLAELHARADEHTLAQKAFERARALQPSAEYTKIAYADYLLARKRAPQVLALLGGALPTLSDATLLRLSIAAKQTNAATATRYANELKNRITDDMKEGITAHMREAALFALTIEGDAATASTRALRNWSVQKEPTDALLLLRAGLAACNKEAIATARAWHARSGYEDQAFAQTSCIGQGNPN